MTPLFFVRRSEKFTHSEQSASHPVREWARVFVAFLAALAWAALAVTIAPEVAP